jgi:hypothetical protein
MASTYYVSPSGDDAQSGLSPSAAWATVDRVNQATLGPGDTVLFAGGHTFAAGLYLDATKLGTAAQPLVVSSYGRGRAILDAGDDFGIMVHNGAGVEIRNLEVRGNGVATNQSIGIYCATDAATPIQYEHLWIDSVEVHGFLWGGILVGPNADTAYSGFRDIRITHTLAHHNGDAGINVYGKQLNAGYTHADIYVGYCQAYHNEGVRQKTWSHTGNGIVVGNAKDVVVEYCVAYENGAENRYTGGGPVGIWLWDTYHGVIQYCESHHNRSKTLDGGGFDLDGGCDHCTMQYNYAHDNEGAGYLLAGYPGARPLRHLTIRYNISQNDGQDRDYGAIHLWKAANAVLEKVDVYNNTVYMDATTGNSAAFKVTAPGITQVQVFNNSFTTHQGLSLIDHDYVGGTQVQFRHNAYYSSGQAFKIRYDGRTYPSLAQWQAATGQEMENGQPVAYQGDPRLKDQGLGPTVNQPGAANFIDAYQLEVTSPLPGSGLDLVHNGLNPGAHDFFLSPILSGTHRDIGAAISPHTTLGESALSWTAEGYQLGIAIEVDTASPHLPEYLEYKGEQDPDFRTIATFSQFDQGQYTHSPRVEGQHWYRLRGRDSLGHPWYSRVKAARWEAPATIELVDLGDRGWLIDGLDPNLPWRFSLIDLQGRVRQQGRLNQRNFLHIAKRVPAGHYWLYLHSGERQLVTGLGIVP